MFSFLPPSSCNILIYPIPLLSIGAVKKTATTNAFKENNDKEDDTVEDLTLTPEDAFEALSALHIEGWEGLVQEAMGSTNWQIKSDAVTLIGQKIMV